MVLPVMDGASAIRSIRRQFPQVIALTSPKGGELIKNALEAGSIGYLLKGVSAEELVRAIHTTFSSDAAQSLVAT